VRQTTRTLLGNMVTNQPCSNCQGFGTVIPDPCNSCHGEGRVRTERTLSVKIPGGVREGTRILLTGQGEVGPWGGPAADLHLEVAVAEDPVFSRDGDNLRATLRVPMTAAALGTSVTVDTFDGPREVDIEAGTQSGTQTRLAGLGATRLRRNSRGDLVLTILVQTPQKVTEEQRELLERLAGMRGEHDASGLVDASAEKHAKGPFSRLRDKFAGR
jgi:molecular chaperone DnaJ